MTKLLMHVTLLVPTAVAEVATPVSFETYRTKSNRAVPHH